jgi:LCP family protein required for cell wall assembly
MIIPTVFYTGDLVQPHNPVFWLVSFLIFILSINWLLKGFVYVLCSSWYDLWFLRRKVQARQARAGVVYEPMVSVIIPAYNEEVGLVATLKTAVASTYTNMEVIVINDGSSDGTEQEMRSFLQKYNLANNNRPAIPVRYRYQLKTGKGMALNTGIRMAHGEIIVTFDADCAVHKDCIKQLVTPFVDPAVMAVSGNIRIGDMSNILGIVQSLEYAFGFFLKKAEALFGTVLVVGGACAAYRREVFFKMGGFDKRFLTEDMEMSFRIQQAGLRVAYAPRAVVHTEGPSTLRGLIEQRIRWKRGRIETTLHYRSEAFSKKSKNKLFFWLAVPLVYLDDIVMVFSVVLTLLLYFYSVEIVNYSFLYALIAMSSFIYLLVFLEDNHDRNIKRMMIVPLVYFLSHLSVVIEVFALITAYVTVVARRKIEWQKRPRRGVTFGMRDSIKECDQEPTLLDLFTHIESSERGIIKRSCEFCGSEVPDHASFCGICEWEARSTSQAVRRIGDFNPPKRKKARLSQPEHRGKGCLISTAVALLLLIILGGITISTAQIVLAFGSALSTQSPLSTQTGYMGTSDRVNILILGYGGSGHDGAYLTDSMIVMSLMSQSHHTTLISVPRDLWIQYPLNSGKYHKINTVYSIASNNNADPVAGGDAAAQMVSLVTGLDVKYWIAINFTGFRVVINAIGGVDVNVPDSFTSSYPKNDDPNIDASWIMVHFAKGLQHMDGEKAIEYARARHVVDNLSESTDFARSVRQQLIMKAAITKLKDWHTWPRFFSALDTLKQCLYTNLSLADLTHFALKMDLNHAHYVGLNYSNSLNGATSSDGQDILLPRNDDWDAIKIYLNQQLYK